jgi:hypothetical protein
MKTNQVIKSTFVLFMTLLLVKVFSVFLASESFANSDLCVDGRAMKGARPAAFGGYGHRVYCPPQSPAPA